MIKATHRASRSLRSCSIAVALGLLCLAQSTARAQETSEPIDVMSDNFMWIDLVESSATDPLPLFGEPTFVMGDSLLFYPITSFSSFAEDLDSDITDSFFRTTIMSKDNGVGINTIELFESGAYGLTSMTQARSVVDMLDLTFQIIEIDGTPIADLGFTSAEMSGTGEMIFSPDHEFELTGLMLDDMGEWEGTAVLDIGQFLDDLDVDGEATKVFIRFDNQLQTLADEGSSAYIDKKEFRITVDPVIPEPSSLALAGLGCIGIGLGLLARRRGRVAS